MKDYKKHLINISSSVREVLERLNNLSPNPVCFLTDKNNSLQGSVTDGDIRRGILNGKKLEDPILEFANKNPHSLKKESLTPFNFQHLIKEEIKIIPIVDKKNTITEILDLSEYKSLLPLEAVIIAGGKGTRLRPMTETIPKPLLKVGGKPIIEYMIDRLISFGIQTIHISINYLGEQIVNYFGDGSSRGISIKYIKETDFLGTAGALALNIHNYQSKVLMFMNSDLLTDIDFSDMYSELINQDGDMIIASVPYEVQIPYGVIETVDGKISKLKEKPTYTYYSNAGIYMIKTEHITQIPQNTFYNATDLIENLIASKNTVLNFPIRSYWLDIGKHHDFKKAQEDIKHLKLS